MPNAGLHDMKDSEKTNSHKLYVTNEKNDDRHGCSIVYSKVIVMFYICILLLLLLIIIHCSFKKSNSGLYPVIGKEYNAWRCVVIGK